VTPAAALDWTAQLVAPLAAGGVVCPLAPGARLYTANVSAAPFAHGSAATVGVVDDTMATQGWQYLWLYTAGAYPDRNGGGDDMAQAYAAGDGEAGGATTAGYPTGVHTGAHLSWDPALEAFLLNNTAWMAGQIDAAAGAASPYWYQVSLVLVQLMGLYDGYCDAAPASQRVFDFRAFLNIQLAGDMDDLSAAVGLAAYGTPLPHPRTAHRLAAMRGVSVDEPGVVADAARPVLDADAGLLAPVTDGAGHCSALAMVLRDPATGAATDLLAAQTAWSGFEDMLRLYKTYEMGFAAGPGGAPGSLPGRQAAFSSYGGSLFSGDDWYTLQPSSLVVLETTIGNSNATLYALYVSPATVLDWVRNIVANRVAADAPAWAGNFSLYNSGTYNNEWFILNYRAFHPGAPTLANDTLWVLDQLPGYITAGDRTDALRGAGYLASYNVPSWPDIYTLSGEAALAAQYGPWFSYNATARANIFARNVSYVHDEYSFRALMRYNDFQHDPLAAQGCDAWPPTSAENAVACRDDLNPANGTYSISALGHRDHAAIDVKYTSWAGMDPYATGTMVQAGPTYDQQPPFAWSTTTPDIAALPHLGMPDAWTMPYVWVRASIV